MNVIDPCVDTTILTPTSISEIIVINGETQTRTYSESSIQAEVDNAGLSLCGSKTHSIVDAQENTVSWLTLAESGGTYTITAAPTDDALVAAG